MMEAMYDPSNRHIGRDASRASDTDLMMFGHYVNNNIGIDFKIYAMGIFFGIGTAFVTLYNGVVIGAVAGHLTGLGFGETFWSFVVGHGSFELTAIVISAAAGLRLATPLIAPAPFGRKDAFLVAGKQSIQLLLGAALMTFVAAFIEAFWSSSTLIPNAIKYGVAALLWLFVGWYLLFCGKAKNS
ncbi:MAG: stage II sporulation protein M, partial [Moraxella sp.]|nr:stage II sporulation protein M [Moraxella sp.]